MASEIELCSGCLAPCCQIGTRFNQEDRDVSSSRVLGKDPDQITAITGAKADYLNRADRALEESIGDVFSNCSQPRL